jgi:peptide deformylase
MSYKPKALQLVVEPDPRLHIMSKEVTEVTDEIRNLMEDMLFTMYKSEGIGLAAVQVGIHLKVVVIDIDYCEKSTSLHSGKPIFMVNPVIVDKSQETVTFCEGCLSLPTVRADVTRYDWIVVEYLDYNGEKQQSKFTGLLSICAQHEIDHTNGIIFIDHLSRLKKEFFMKKLIKLRKQMGYE